MSSPSTLSFKDPPKLQSRDTKTEEPPSGPVPSYSSLTVFYPLGERISEHRYTSVSRPLFNTVTRARLTTYPLHPDLSVVSFDPDFTHTPEHHDPDPESFDPFCTWGSGLIHTTSPVYILRYPATFRNDTGTLHYASIASTKRSRFYRSCVSFESA